MIQSHFTINVKTDKFPRNFSLHHKIVQYAFLISTLRKELYIICLSKISGKIKLYVKVEL